jgi:hypothetical protein
MLRKATLGILCSASLVPFLFAQERAPIYEEEVRLLSAHTKVLELRDEQGARVAVCPQWQGRVMTSTCDGDQGVSFGWINHKFIKEGQTSKVFNNYGGEDRFWISPEAGQFAFFFEPKAEQKVANWLAPPGLNEGEFRALALFAGERQIGYRMNRRMQLTNYSGGKFDLDVTRTIKLLGVPQFEELFGTDAGAPLRAGKARLVGFASDNSVVNRGERMKREKGLLSIWTLGQFKPGDHTVIIIPYVAGKEPALGPVVTPDYFAPLPPERLKVTPKAILFLGDGKFRAKIGVSPQRAKAVAGSYDFDQHILTIVSYSQPADAAERMYINNRWELPLAEPYQGDAFNSYNDGPAEPGAEALGGFYELETLSPTLELAPNEALDHTHRTFHLLGDQAALAAIARAVLEVDLSEVRLAMFGDK